VTVLKVGATIFRILTEFLIQIFSKGLERVTLLTITVYFR